MAPSDLKIPIEENPELLTEYGRAFAWINMIEMLVEHLITYGGKPRLPKIAADNQLMWGKTLGQKIDLIETIIPSDLIAKLKALNEKRIILAHGKTSKKVATVGGKVMLNTHLIEHKGKAHELTMPFLNEITEQCKKLSANLMATLAERK